MIKKSFRQRLIAIFSWGPLKRFHHPFLVPVFTLVFLVVIFSSVYLLVFMHQPAKIPLVVIISHDNVTQVVPSTEPTVGKLLNKLDIKLSRGDIVEPSLTTAINQDDFRINIIRAVPVEIIGANPGQTIYTFSAAQTPRAIANQAGLQLYSADNVSMQPVNNFLTNRAVAERVVINRATPVNINIYGAQTVIRTHAQTVGQLLKQKNIVLASNDQVIPSLTTPLTSQTEVFLIRKGVKIVSVSQTIPMPIETNYTDSLAYGTSSIEQVGSAGTEVVTYQENPTNSQVVSSTVIQTVVTNPPVTEIVLEGTNLSGIKGDMAIAGIPPQDYGYADYIISHESGWCPTKAQGESYCPAIPDNPMTPNGYGLCQATPGYKMASAGSDWETNPITQLEWCNGYAINHYGGWAEAYQHWLYYSWW